MYLAWPQEHNGKTMYSDEPTITLSIKSRSFSFETDLTVPLGRMSPEETRALFDKWMSMAEEAYRLSQNVTKKP